VSVEKNNNHNKYFLINNRSLFTQLVISSAEEALNNLKSWRENLNGEEAAAMMTLNANSHAMKQDEVDCADDVNPYENLVNKSLLSSQESSKGVDERLNQWKLPVMDMIDGVPTATTTGVPNITSSPDLVRIKLQNIMSQVTQEALSQQKTELDVGNNKGDVMMMATKLTEEFNNISFGLALGEEIDGYANELEELLEELDRDLD
jgi:hypothetical protein